MITKIFFAALAAYLLGSITVAVPVCKLFGLPDPRSQGSNNPGATNVLRIGGKKAAIITLIGDALKGVLAVMLAKQLQLPTVGLAAVMVAVGVGHLFPVFFRFQGGKGVATACGVFLAFSWPLGVLLVGVWAIVVFGSRLSSLGAIVAAITALYCGWWLYDPVYSIAISCIALLLLLRHKHNIVRLIKREEASI